MTENLQTEKLTQVKTAPQDTLESNQSFSELGRWRLKKLLRKLRIHFSPWSKHNPPLERIQADLLQEPKEPRPTRPKPLALAQFYQSLINTGIYENRAAVARHLGISRARVTQDLRRQKPSDQDGSKDSTVQGGGHNG